MSAVQVVQLHKHFTRRKTAAGRRARPRVVHDRPRRVRRRARPERLGQVDARAPALDAAAARRRRARACSATTSCARSAPIRRSIVNRVSVEASFFKKMSATENLSYAARFYGIGAAPDAHGRSRRSSSSVGFPRRPAPTSPMEDLSRGMQQKVALARALLTSPTLLLLDEPTTGLDPRAKLEVQAFIRELRREHDTTTLLCTHDMAEAETLADRVGILDRGRLLALEDARALKRRYRAETLEAGVPRGDRARVRGRGRSTRRRPRWARSACRRSPSAGRRRAQHLPDQALRPVGARVLRLDRSRTRSRSCSSPTASRPPAGRSTSSARRRSC